MGRKPKYDHEAIERMRVDGSTIKAIVERFKCTKAVVYDVLRKRDVSMDGRTRILHQQAVEVAKGRNVSAREVAKALGVRDSALSRAFKMFGKPPNVAAPKLPGSMAILAALQRGMTQSEVARLLSVSRQRVNQVFKDAVSSGVNMGNYRERDKDNPPAGGANEQQRREDDSFRGLGGEASEVREDDAGTRIDVPGKEIGDCGPGAG